MFEDEYEFDYDRIVEDTDELYDHAEYADYSDEPDDEYDYDYTNEREYDAYYHNVMDELDYEQPFSSGGRNLVGQVFYIKHLALSFLSQYVRIVPSIFIMTNILNESVQDVRRTDDGKYIQGSSHICHVLNHKERNKIIVRAVCKLRKIQDSFDSIACCGVSGLMVVPQIAELLNKHIVVVRKGEKCYSEFRTEGVAPFRYIIVDDLICSGSTVKHIKRVLHDEYPRSVCQGVYCYLPNETAYRDDESGNKLCQRDLGISLLNLS